MYEKLLNKYAINQLGYVTTDPEKTANQMAAALGAGPFVHFQSPRMAKAVFRGEEVEYDVELAYGMYGDLQIELITPLDDAKTPYTELKPGFNHFSCWVDDFDQAVQDFKDAGFEVAFEMWSSQGLHVAYIDCLEAFGHYVEIHNPQPFLIDLCKKFRDGWDGTNPYFPMPRG